MTPSVFQDAAWYRATTLAERIATRRARDGSRESEHSAPDRRLLRWRSQPPFTNPAVFAQRLALDGIAEEEFLAVLGEPPERFQRSHPEPPPWLVALSEAFSVDSRDPPPRTIPPLEEMGEKVFGLVRSVELLIAHSVARLRERLPTVLGVGRKAPVDCETIERILLRDLPQQLVAMLSRTLVLELNVARLEGLLDGDTPQERFQSFVGRVRQPEIALRILHEYPVLARQLLICLDQWVAVSLEFLERLCVDWELIRDTFSLNEDPGVLVHLRTDAGDRHRSGRSVSIAKFHSGFQLVYKPKSMAVDLHFQDLLTWMNQRGGEPEFRTLQILDRGSHGWAEFIPNEPCDSLAALRRFFERQGAYLALLHVLEATDLHAENVIAAGQHPVLIDLEALFQPRCPLPQAEREDVGSTTIDNSVLRVGLLPERDWSSAESEGIDVSGLGGQAGQLTPFAVPDWEMAGTDEMHLARKRLEMRVANNRSALNGQDVNPADYVLEICTGFTRTYRLLLKHRDALLAVNGPLMWFADDEVRAVLRPTRTYLVVLDESFHPDVLRDALDRDLLFDRLWGAVESLPHLTKVIGAECADLQHGDIPIFTTRPCSRDVWTSSGRRIQGFFDEPALAVVQRRLRELGEGDLELQLWIIRASLATVASESADRRRRPAAGLNGGEAAVDRAQLLRAARTVGERLESVAIRANQRASWIGLILENERNWSIAPLSLDLYDGLPGVALLLAYLGAITGERRYTLLAQDACATMLRRSKECEARVTAIGAFDGWGGVIYSLTHLGAMWHAPDLLAAADAIVGLLPAWIGQDERFDIIGGAAGCIGGLITLHHRLPSERTLSAAIKCGEHLMAHMQQTERGVGWIIPPEREPLAGFAHGSAGIAWALLKLAALSGIERFRTAALAAIAYERTLFSPQAGNWRDLRVPAGRDSRRQVLGESFMTAWCSGAPGIGLARLSTIEQLDDPEIRGEIAAALQTTLADGFGHDHSLCHGDLGNLELLLQAGQVLRDGRWHAAAYRLASPIVASVTRNEYVCSTPLNIDSPGLMTGLAGLGYGLLRLAEPARVPSVLTLDPPRQD